MTIEEAIILIRDGVTKTVEPSHWSDLGCGTGVFTNALAMLLGNGSTILAVDVQGNLKVHEDSAAAAIEFKQLDFVRQDLPVNMLDGILMANALHYVEDKVSFIEKLKLKLKDQGIIILVEYDTDRSNRWVPYPLKFSRCAELFSSLGFGSVTKIGERKSVYQSGKMYAALIA